MHINYVIHRHMCVYILRGCAHGRAAQAEARGEQFLSILRPLNSLKISKRLRLLNPLKVSKHFQAPKLPSNLSAFEAPRLP